MRSNAPGCTSAFLLGGIDSRAGARGFAAAASADGTVSACASRRTGTLRLATSRRRGERATPWNRRARAVPPEPGPLKAGLA
jgi:hypothetical protein